MTKTKLPYLFIAYFSILTGLYFFPMESMVKDVFVSPFYLMFPMGIGYFLLSIAGGKSAFDEEFDLKGQVVLSSLLGTVIITYSFYFLETINYLKAQMDMTFWVFKLCSLIGLLRFVGIKRRNRGEVAAYRNTFFYVLAIALVAGISYYIKFIHFSKFPLMDVFQNVHFMKGGHEFSKFGILNLNTADSYMPTLQIMWGIFHRYYSFDLFAANILFLFPIFIFHILALFSFLESILYSRLSVWLCTLFLLSVSGFGLSLSLNEQLTCLVLVLMGTFVRRCLKHEMMRDVLVEGIAWLLGFGLAYFISQRGYVTSGLALAITMSAIFMTSRIKPEWGRPALIFLFLIVAPAYHRAALMFLPLAIFFGITIYLVMVFFNHKSTSVFMYQGVRTLSKWYFIIVSTVFLICYFSFYLNVLHFDADYFRSIPYKIFSFIFQKKLKGGPTGSGGGFMAVIEWIRIVPISLQVICGILIFGLFVKEIFQRRKMLWEQVPGTGICENLKAAVWVRSCFLLLFFIVLLTVLAFSGIPHIHRSQFFTTLFFCILLVKLSVELFQIYPSLQKPLSITSAIVMSFFIYLASVNLYNFQWDAREIGNLYLRKLAPLQHYGILIVFGLAVCVVLFRRNIRINRIAFFALIIFSLMVDSRLIKVRFYEVSFGSRFPDPKVISHFTQREVNLAMKFRNYGEATVLFSDPFTVSIFKAVTGLNGFVSYENIADVNPNYVKPWKEMISVLQGSSERTSEGPPRKFTDMLAKFIEKNSWAGPEARYVYNQHLSKEYKPETLLQNMVFIFSNRSLLWAKNGYNYYSNNEILPKRFFDNLEKHDLEIIENIEDRIVVAKMK